MRPRRVKSALRSVAARLYYASNASLAQLAGKVLILTYHRVIPRGEFETTFVQPGMYVAPETFERHLRFFTNHFTLLSFQDLLDMWQDDSWDPAARYCTITFDDGWLDNHRYAYPLLRAYGAPATIFLPTDLIGTHGWLWPDRLGFLLQAVNGRRAAEAVDTLVEQAKTLSDEARNQLLEGLARASGLQALGDRRFLNWAEVRDMSSHGIAFGSHTCTHAALDRLDRAQLQRELRHSADVLRREGVNFVPVLSYPYGDHSAAVVAEARAAGYRAAVTTHAGLESRRPANLFRLQRVGVHDDVSRSIPLLVFHIARQARPTRQIA